MYLETYFIERLWKKLPYNAMGGQHTIPILVLQELWYTYQWFWWTHVYWAMVWPVLFQYYARGNIFIYLLEMREIDSVLECWEILQELKELEEPDCYDKEELEIQQNTLEEYFQEYRTYTREPTEDQLEAAMEKVLEWNKEREHLLEGNVPDKSLGR